MKICTRLIGECADALLTLSDGYTVPCSKFVMMATCPVLCAMMELDTELSEGKYVIPVADSGHEKYENFCKVVHCVLDVSMLTYEQLLDVHDCARRFASEDIERAALTAAWEIAPSPKTTSEIVPYLFSLGQDIIADVMTTAAMECPLWTDLERVFLEPLAPYMTDTIARVMLRLQYHYPPSAVAKWLLTHLPHTPTEDLVFKIATANSHLYGPNEIRPVYNELVNMYTARGWNPYVWKLASAVMDSTAWNNSVPLLPGGIAGTYVEYEDLPRSMTYASFPAGRTHSRKLIQLSPALRIQLPKKDLPFAFDVHGGNIRGSTFQIRVIVSRRVSLLNPMFEAWYEFENVSKTTWTRCGDPLVAYNAANVSSELSKTRHGVMMRFDFRWGLDNAIRSPFA